MAKVSIKSEKFTPFWEFYFTNKAFILYISFRFVIY